VSCAQLRAAARWARDDDGAADCGNGLRNAVVLRILLRTMSDNDEDELTRRRRRREEERIQPRQERMLTLSPVHRCRTPGEDSNPLPTETISGYLVALSPALAVVHVFDDFEPDGYTVVDVEQIASLTCGPGEQLWDRILMGKALLDGLQLTPLLS
jgi:hypothetical protein